MSDVITRIEGRAGRITLNRPQALNALTLDMVRAIDAALHAWATDPAVHLVVLDGAGPRGLCAGGDIRALFEAARSGDPSFPQEFFRDEYRLNALIARYPKPYVALMDGIVMGGGIGLSAHGAHRVVTERSRLAMPEVGIGFFPDVGGTWLLGRVPGELGTHAALTAGTMNAADAILCGLADVHVPASSLPALGTALAGCADAAEVRTVLAGHAQPAAPGRYEAARPWIAACFAGNSVAAILSALRAHPDPGAHAAAAEIATRSPTALAITLRALRRAARLGRLEPCLEAEYGLALACLRLPDFVEGVRAAVVDKDRTPRWQPDRLEHVAPAVLDAALTAAAPAPLDLDARLASWRASNWPAA